MSRLSGELETLTVGRDAALAEKAAASMEAEAHIHKVEADVQRELDAVLAQLESSNTKVGSVVDSKSTII